MLLCLQHCLPVCVCTGREKELFNGSSKLGTLHTLHGVDLLQFLHFLLCLCDPFVVPLSPLLTNLCVCVCVCGGGGGGGGSRYI